MEQNTLKFRPCAIYFDNCYLPYNDHQIIRKFLEKNYRYNDPLDAFPYTIVNGRILTNIEGINYYPTELQIHSLSGNPNHISNHISAFNSSDFITALEENKHKESIGYFIAGRRCIRSQKFATMMLEFRNSFDDLGYINFSFSSKTMRIVVDDRGSLYGVAFNFNLLPIFSPDVIIQELNAHSIKAQKQIIEICNILTKGGFQCFL